MKTWVIAHLVQFYQSTVHILLECCSLKHVRENYFTCSSLKELFENVDATTIKDFIKEVNFYHLV